MEATNVLLKIYKMLGLQFNEQKFAMVKLKDTNTTITNNMDEELKLGQEIYIVGENSELKPAPSGKHTLENGIVIELNEASKLVTMMNSNEEVEESDYEVKTMEEEMTRAEATDGKILESDTFDVGEKIYMVDGDETKPAPNGEYEISLKDTSGNENKIKLFVNDGVITERENVETMSEIPVNPEPMADLMTIQEEMMNIKMAMEEMLGYLRKREEKMSEEMSSLKSDFESFKKSPSKTPMVEHKNVNQSFEDWRVEQLKKLKN